MKDLDHILNSAATRSSSWSRADVQAAIDTTQQLCPGSIVNWDATQENWAMVYYPDGDVIARVCLRIPMMLVNAKSYSSGRIETGKYQAILSILMADLDAREFKVSSQLLSEIFSKQMTEVLDYSKVSLNEIWYATVDK